MLVSFVLDSFLREMASDVELEESKEQSQPRSLMRLSSSAVMINAATINGVETGLQGADQRFCFH